MKTKVQPNKSDKKEIKSLLKQLAKIDMNYLPHEKRSKEDIQSEKKVSARLHELNVLDSEGATYNNTPGWIYKILDKVY